MRFKKTLRDDESPSQRLPSLLLGNLGQNSLEIFHIIMLIPPDHTARDLNTLPNGEANTLVRDDDISTLRKCGDDTGNSRERLCVNYTSSGPKIRRDIRLGFHMHILSAVKSSRATRTDTVVAEGLDGLLLERLVRIEVVKVKRPQVHNRATIRQLRLGTNRTAQGKKSLGISKKNHFCRQGEDR